MIGLVLLPCFMFLVGVRNGKVGIVRAAAILAIVGVIANRLTVCLFAFDWQLPHRVFFYWKEILVTAAILTTEILIYRWIVNHLPVHLEHPSYKGMH